MFRRRVDGNDDIWIVNADGTGARFLVGGPAGEYDPDWSPDGTRVAFISNEGGSFDIWTFEVESVTTIGAPPSLEAAFATRVTDHPGDEEYPDWTADSQSIVFHSNRHGVSTVWIMGADGSGQSALVFDFPVFWPQLAP